MNDFGKVAVLLGGTSFEREVSLKSGAGVLAALQQQGIDAQAFDPGERQLDELRAFDRAFIALHGRHGEDGTIQGALELLRIPYTGSGVMASALGMDKWRSKLLWQAAGLSTPKFALLNEHSDFDAIEAELGLPLFVKPANEGSSIGISMLKEAGQLRAAYQFAKQYDNVVIAEAAILGGEYTVAILDESTPTDPKTPALPIIKIEPANDFYDYEAKYLSAETIYKCPCGLSKAHEEALQQQALTAFRVIGCRGWGRVDFLLDNDGKAHFLEVNTAPGMTDHSLAPMAARAAGISYESFVQRVLALASLA